MDRGAWWATIHRVTELDMTEVTAHVCTEQTFPEVSLCSTASSLLLPQILSAAGGGGAWVSSLLLLSVQEPLYFCQEIRNLFTERSQCLKLFTFHFVVRRSFLKL